jgi:hypothetical protein
VAEQANEQRTRVEVFDSLWLPPVECFLPRTVGLRRQREGGRAQCQHAHQQRFIVYMAAKAEEAFLLLAAVDDRDIFDGLGRPAVCVARNSVQRPLPVGAAIEGIGGFADFTLDGRIRVKKTHPPHASPPAETRYPPSKARTLRRDGRLSFPGSHNESPSTRSRPAPALAGCARRIATRTERVRLLARA